MQSYLQTEFIEKAVCFCASNLAEYPLFNGNYPLHPLPIGGVSTSMANRSNQIILSLFDNYDHKKCNPATSYTLPFPSLSSSWFKGHRVPKEIKPVVVLVLGPARPPSNLRLLHPHRLPNYLPFLFLFKWKLTPKTPVL